MSSYDNKYDDSKQGSKCCGCCCDMRRAVIAVNMISIGLSVAGLIFLLVGRDVLTDNISNDAGENDEAIEILEDAYTDQAIIVGIGIAFYLLAIAGASLFNLWLVGLGVCWYIASFVAGSVLSYQAFNDFEDEYVGSEDVREPYPSLIINGVIMALFVYPHIGLMLEIKKGIMTRQTYPREEHSCCCTT